MARHGWACGSDLARGFADGTWFVDLAEVRDPDLVPNAVLAALDLRDQSAARPVETLVAYLQGRRLLLVLDNCEHVLAAAGKVVAEIPRAAPNVRVIATSREPLQVSGEQVIPVAPVELPQARGTEPLAHVRQNEAIALFAERAAAASGAFEVTGDNQAAVVALCRRLDGLPLAIELAAVRTRVLSVEQILDTAREIGQLALLTESLAVSADHLAIDEAVATLHMEEAEAVGASLKTYPGRTELLQARAIHAMFAGELETVRSASAEGLDLSPEAGDLYQLETMLRNLATAAMMSGDLAAANSSCMEALQVGRQVDNRLTQPYGLAAAGWYAGSSGQARTAAQLLGAAEALKTQTGSDISGPSVPYVDRAREAAVAVDATTGGPLARRELEVSKLIAEGLTNKKIGAQLFISERTVASHVRSIMDKLVFNNRAQIAVWMTMPA